MNIMNEYTYHQIKKNKRHTISILVAITIASALLCSLCIFIYSFWQGKVISTIENTGYWHGELWESTSGDKLKYIIENPKVESTMIKGTWVTAQLYDTKQPYFLMRDANKNFWNDMNFKNTIMEGRLPEREGEIVVSKLFFSENSSYNVGDELTIPIGNRILGDKILKTQDYKQDNEKFKPTGTKNYTIVGSIDVSGVSAYPGYIAMGYLDDAKIEPIDELTIYIRLANPREIYEEMPIIAESVGLQKNSGEQYAIRYNTSLLNLYGISEKGQANTQFIIITAMATIFLILIMGTFILIIYNAFSLSSNSRSKELSVLKSLGATPKQIKYSVLYEGFLLWVIQSPVGIVIGYVFSSFVFSKVNEILNVTDNYKNMDISFSWVVITFSLVISLITVLISAYIPAKKMSKVPAVEGINQISPNVKKEKDIAIWQRLLGIEGELAIKQFVANKKSMRTAITSLSLCLILITSYVNIISIYNLAESKNDEITHYDMAVNLNLLEEPNTEMIQKIITIPEVKDSVIRRQVRTTTYVTKAEQSNIFSNLGGFASINDNKYNIVKERDTYRIVVYLVGLSNESFQTYCKEIGTEYENYYNDDKVIGILQDSTYHIPAHSKELQKVPMLNLPIDASMLLQEKVYDDMEGDYKFNIKIGAITDKFPGQFSTSRYSASLILPMEKYQQIVSNFITDRKLEANRMSIDLLVGDENSTKVKEKILQISDSYLGSEDFTIWSLLEEKNYDALMQQAIAIAVYAVAIMIGAIGIFNTFSVITNNLQIHKREYAMLRSIGLTPSGLNKILLLEGLLFILSPFIISTPCVLAICFYMLKLTMTTWNEFMSIFPIGAILLYVGCIFTAIFLAYWGSSKTIKQGNIIEAIKDEIV